ncbi:TonB-dependent receptor [Croceicoccus marinus]|uniref:TonB-dependent receptor n=1 Tax=Croceicoccus marinus TaxID=450378 RepID=A0A1Z1FH05_9SPHN|nr:TonB-dependent receptor [Croceicoccus marinus]ARU17997.1 TonB-dependent receptor [Croceicoccus marinus]QNE07502.1 TonB-dependent receptor [Croceicoccus marinus]
MRGTEGALCGASKLAIVLAAMTMPGLAIAQTQQPEAGDDADSPEEVANQDLIVVTGLRQSLETSQEIKRNSDQFVDSITAQDIGRLPDVNVAEALQRVSGVQITRNRGEGNAIAVRGLTQVRTELNGRDIFQASGGRGLSWDEVGSELLAGVDVYKNPAANMIEGGLAGTVNLRTRMPFDSRDEIIAATGAVTYYDLIGESGQQASGLYSNRWDTGIGEIGFLANIGYQTTSFREDNVVVEPFYQHGPAAPGVQGPVPGYEDQTVLLPHGGGFSVAYGDRERISGLVALQWRPTDTIEFYGQYFQADYEFNEAGVSFFSYGSDVGPSPDREFTVDEDGIVRTGYLDNPNSDSATLGTNRDTSTSEISGGMIWDLAPNLKLQIDYQHIDSTVEARTLNLTASAINPRTGLAGIGQDYDFFFDINGDVPVFQSTTPGYYADLSNYAVTAILPYAEENDANADALRADLTWDFDEGGFLDELQVGTRYTDKSAINRNTTYGTWTGVGSCANWSSPENCYRLSDFPQYAERNRYQSDLLRGDAADTVFGPVWQFSDALSANPQAAFDAFEEISGTRFSFRPYDSPDAFLGTIDEKTYAAYARLGFGGELAALPFDGNVGLRFVRTETGAQGRRVLTFRDPTDPTTSLTLDEDFGGGQDYDKWLPSANMRVYLTDELILRAAFSKNFSRPSFDQLNPQFNLGVSYADGNSSIPQLVDPNQPYDPDTNPYVGTGTARGDPNLLPEDSTSYDLALEWYFDSSGYVYLTGFNKDIKNLLVLRPSAPFREDVPDVGVVQFNAERWINEASGYVRGFEVGGQAFASFLPAPFDGLGLQANYTFADSDAGQTAAGDINSVTQISVPLNNLSKHSYNLVGLFDKGPVEIRVAYNWRGEYLQGTANTGTQNLPIFGDSFGILDASFTLDVTERFAITVDAQNILDTAITTHQVFDERPRDYKINDRRFSIRTRVLF